MTTKAYHRFSQRIAYYNSDVELVEVLVGQFVQMPNTNDNIAVSLGCDAGRYPNLARRVNVRDSRKIVGGHLKATLHASFIKDLFEDFSEFIADTMTKAAQAGIDPARFVGEIKLDIHAAEILGTGGWDAAVKLVSDAIFRKLENERNTKDLIRKASARLGLALETGIVEAAMPFLDARHILVHRDGTADELYRRDYPQIALRKGKIVVNFDFVLSARAAVDALARHIDDRIIHANLVRNQDMHGRQ
ncbi:hypothetical protein [uncultured Sphingomonas sp.]|uniref:hypothetical protein n=1 Tax=uncultured Sphingomonas sp. TaxID=158754 RepID=UPI0025F6D213|nr:hypothetical protein [uncultured Sphingomonas sp.]